MICKQVYLTEDLNRRLTVAAKQLQKSEAQVLRDILDAGLRQQQETAGAALLRLAALGQALGIQGPPDTSMKIDDYLYGDVE